MEEITEILFDLFIIFALAKVAGEVFTRIHQPAIVAEVLVGVAIGPHALALVGKPDADLISLFHNDEESAREALNIVFDVIAELGVILLLFFVGLETRLGELMAVRGRAVAVGVLGIIFPFAMGFTLIYATGRDDVEAAFVATAMVATSVGITARVMSDIGVIRTQEARIILGAAVVDDILGLLLLAVVSSWGADDIDVAELGLTALGAVAFVIFAALVGTRVTRRYSVHLERLHVQNAPFIVSMMLMLGLSALAGIIGLAAIIGAFLAGMILAEADEQLELERQSRPVYEFLVPFFFVIIGTKVDLDAFTDLDILALALGITALAIAGKLIGGGLGARLPAPSAAIVGVGMVPRGEVGLVAAGIGSGIGAVSSDMFGVVVFMSIATTVLAPPVLVALYERQRRDSNLGRAIELVEP
ncbi:MAG TPA: cation:proton antiporter [Dehalococcoidia bacterium]|nr:cation:proton antiporter [Dehalococcoidia bacterium]